MNDRTRELLSLAGDEVTAHVLAHLCKPGRTEAELRDSCGVPHRTIHDRLTRLREIGVVSYEPGVSSGRGRPAGRWVFSGKGEFDRLLNTARIVTEHLRA